MSCTCTGCTVPELTSVRYPDVKRGDFGCLETADVEFFKKFLNNPGQVLTEDDELVSYNVDWMGNYRGNSLYIYIYSHKDSMKIKLEMWANAQRDGRPGEHRWRPLFNAAKFG